MEQDVPRAALAVMEVEKIVAASFGENGKRCYKVQWKESWVFEDHLFSCKELVESFWKEQKKETGHQITTPTSTGGIKRDAKGDVKKNVTVIVLDKDGKPQSVSARDGGADSEVGNEWILDDLENEEEAQTNNDSWFVTSQTKKTRPAGSDYALHCHLCKTDFPLVSAFRRHYSDMHPGVKPFACDTCEKRFDRKENLMRHVRIHTGDRRYVCNYCGKGYTDPSGLKKHVINKHNDGPKFTCEHCSTVLVSKERLEKHFATQHMAEFEMLTEDDHSKNKESDENDGNIDCDEEIVVEEHSEDNIKPPQDQCHTKTMQGINGTQSINETDDDKRTTLEVLMEKSPQSVTISNINIKMSSSEPIHTVVQQLQQYVNEQVVQYVQVESSTTQQSTEEVPTSSNSPERKTFIFDETASRQPHFVLPISAPQLLTINSTNTQNNLQVIPAVQVSTINEPAQLITVPFVYTNPLVQSSEQHQINSSEPIMSEGES